MDDTNQEQREKSDVLDRELDAALTQYATVEPRAGLNERILANITAERKCVPAPAWWRWSAVLVAVVVVTVLLAWKWRRPSQPVANIHPSVSSPNWPSAPHPGAWASTGKASNVRRPAPTAIRPTKGKSDTRRPLPQVAVAARPKLDQFPSPQPLSQQEKILARYVAEYPQHAVLLARARTEALQRDQIEEMQALLTGDGAADSENRN